MSEPPVYLKGKPQYVTVYKPAEKPKKAYQPMPLYLPSSNYMVNPYDSLYGSMMLAGKDNADYTTGADNGSTMESYSVQPPKDSAPQKNEANRDGKQQPKKSKQQDSKETRPSESLVRGQLTINFTDFDDDSGSYYLAKLPTSRRGKLAKYYMLQRSDQVHKATSNQLLVAKSDTKSKPRKKRQVSYTSGYERPCHGFPLEINVKSRIKMDQVFPIFGRSQIKKCVDLTKPLIPPVGHEYPPY